MNAQLGRQFTFVNDNDVAAAGLGNYFFSEQRPAAAFDQIQLRIDLVGPVDCDVNVKLLLKTGQGYAQFPGQVFSPGRTGDSNDVFQLTGFDARGDALDGKAGCGSAAEADYHAGFYKFHRLKSGFLLQLFLGCHELPFLIFFIIQDFITLIFLVGCDRFFFRVKEDSMKKICYILSLLLEVSVIHLAMLQVQFAARNIFRGIADCYSIIR
jgi:hypothetical protein